MSTETAPTPEPEIVQEVASTAVEIATIEAATSIAIAEINADVAQAEIEARHARDLELEECRSRLILMEAELSQARARIAELETPSEPLALEVTEPLTEVEVETISPSTLSDTLVETNETPMAPIVVSESPEEVTLEVPVLSVPKRGPIIQLV